MVFLKAKRAHSSVPALQNTQPSHKLPGGGHESRMDACRCAWTWRVGEREECGTRVGQSTSRNLSNGGPTLALAKVKVLVVCKDFGFWEFGFFFLKLIVQVFFLAFVFCLLGGWMLESPSNPTAIFHRKGGEGKGRIVRQDMCKKTLHMLSQASRRSLRVPHSTGPLSRWHKSPLRLFASTLEQNSAICFCTSCGSPDPQNAQRSVTSTANWAPLKQGRSCFQDLNSPFIARTRDSCRTLCTSPEHQLRGRFGPTCALSGWPASKLDEIECTRLDRRFPSRGSWHPLQTVLRDRQRQAPKNNTRNKLCTQLSSVRVQTQSQRSDRSGFTGALGERAVSIELFLTEVSRIEEAQHCQPCGRRGSNKKEGLPVFHGDSLCSRWVAFCGVFSVFLVQKKCARVFWWRPSWPELHEGPNCVFLSTSSGIFDESSFCWFFFFLIMVINASKRKNNLLRNV